MSDDSSNPTLPVCPYCGSEEVSSDAAVRWDKNANDWVVSAVYDGGYCDECENTTKFFNWIPKQ